MTKHPHLASRWSRRDLLRLGATLGATAPLGLAGGLVRALAGEAAPALRSRSDAKVAIVKCAGYGPEVRQALKRSFDLLGGIGSLVKGKTVAVKINLTGTNFSSMFGRPVGESMMTHESTAMALCALLFEAGATRVRFLESTQSRGGLAGSLSLADWDVRAMGALGKVEFENTRNLGGGSKYSHVEVPSGGYAFSSFEFNHSYTDTDVFISLAKLKQHITAGVTMSMKNLFGITPNSLYGDEAGRENATGGRMPLHGDPQFAHLKLPGMKPSFTSRDAGYRVPHIVADICAARPVHLAIIDGITSMSGGEGFWCAETGPIALVKPGVIITGLNPVSADAVGVAIMGYPDPRAQRGKPPFDIADNHLLLAEASGVGVAELAKIELLGEPLKNTIHPYRPIKYS